MFLHIYLATVAHNVYTQAYSVLSPAASQQPSGVSVEYLHTIPGGPKKRGQCILLLVYFKRLDQI